MDAQLKAKWVEALRSGEFKQGQGRLHNTENDSYCCLGVLCKLSGAVWAPFSEDIEEEYDDGSEVITRNYAHVPLLEGQPLANADDEELSKDACWKFGIEDQSVLIGMNDGERREYPDHPDYKAPKSFSEIADYIEKNL